MPDDIPNIRGLKNHVPEFDAKSLRRERFAGRMLIAVVVLHSVMALLSFYRAILLGSRVGAGFLDLAANSGAHFDTSVPYPGTYVKAAGLLDDALLYSVAVALELLAVSLLFSRLRLKEQLAATRNGHNFV